MNLRVLIFLTMLGGFALPSMAQENSALGLCEALISSKQSDQMTKRQLLWRSLKLKLFPSLYSKPLSKIIELPLKKQISVTNIHLQEDVIFFVGLNSEMREDIDEARIVFKDVMRDLKRISKSFRSAVKSKTIEECMIRITSTGMSVDEVTAVAERMESPLFKNAQRGREEDEFLKQVNRLRRRLKNSWRVETVSHLEKVNQALASTSTRHVIIVTHGKSSGHIIDSYNNQYPNSFFSNISPSLKSLSLYNCYGGKSLETYDLENKLLSAPSFYSSRMLTIAKAPNDATENQVAPLKGFKRFFKKLERKIRRHDFGMNHTSLSQTEKSCSVEIEVDYHHGNPALSLNGHFVGALIKAGSKKFHFPCKWIKEDNNLILFNNISGDAWDVRSIPKIKIEDKVLSQQDFWNADGTLRSSLARF